MKNLKSKSFICLIVILFAFTTCFISYLNTKAESDDDTIISFYDMMFRDALLDSNVDTNGDGKISRGEMRALTSLILYNPLETYAITSIQGIEYAENLTELYLENNFIKDISLLSQIPGLKKL